MHAAIETKVVSQDTLCKSKEKSTNFSIPMVTVEDVDGSTVQPTDSDDTPMEGWSDTIQKVHDASDLSDPQHRKITKGLIEKHTIENVNLESKLQTEESHEIKFVLQKFEEKKVTLVEQAKEELARVLPETTDSTNKYELMVGEMKELEEKLAAIETDKEKAVNEVIRELVEKRITAKKELIK